MKISIRSVLLSASLAVGVLAGPPAGTPTLAGTPALAGDPAQGAREYKKLCLLCHPVKPDGRHNVGPNLYGVVGQPAGRQDGYRYSPAFRETDLILDEAGLDRFLEDYEAVVPGTKKSISGINDAARRSDIIAYMKTLAE